MSPARLRAYVLIVMRDIVSPAVGLGSFVYLLVTRELEPWHLPILAGLIGVPLVGRGGEEMIDPRAGPGIPTPDEGDP